MNYFIIALVIQIILCDPQYITYVNRLTSWTDPKEIIESLGLGETSYSIINLAFWTASRGPLDIAYFWQNIGDYISLAQLEIQFPELKKKNMLRNTNCNNDCIQKYLRDIYHSKNRKVMVSAFGSIDTIPNDPNQVCRDLGIFAINNNLDGVDLDYEDNYAMETGKGEEFLIECTKILRSILPEPNYLITHAPQAPYFMGKEKYPNGGYLRIYQEVGQMIDYFNIQFYNQESTPYDTYECLFQQSLGWALGTSIKEIMQKGVPSKKLLVGKPVTQKDAYNTGMVSAQSLRDFAIKAKLELGWEAGFMTWQFISDDGNFVNTIKQFESI